MAQLKMMRFELKQHLELYCRTGYKETSKTLVLISYLYHRKSSNKYLKLSIQCSGSSVSLHVSLYLHNGIPSKSIYK